MAYGDNGSALVAFATGAQLGTGPGNRQTFYAYRTNDNAAAVEANGYFDGVLKNGLKKGDLIFASLDEDGTHGLKNYVVSIGGADVTVVPEVDAT